MKREHRLRTPADFARVREHAPRGWPHRLLVAYVAPNDGTATRLGITVSGRVGNAVVRNRVRRRLKEALRARWHRLTPGVDVLVIARPPSAAAAWVDLCAALDNVLVRAGATKPASASV
jgi:ribonuclease P protein component